MLIKLKNGTWQDMSNVVGLRVALCKGMSRCYYTILVSMKNGEEFGYKECSDDRDDNYKFCPYCGRKIVNSKE